MKIKLVILFIASGLVGCQSIPHQVYVKPKLQDAAFADYSLQTIETAHEVFSLSPEIKKFVENNTANGDTDKAKLVFLIDAIFARDNLSLSYQASANTIANNTFKSREANCLSLTIMTYAMTQHLGFDAQFQDVLIPEFWTRQDGNTLINRHINLLVRPQDSNRSASSSAPLTVDFDPQQDMQYFKVRELTKSQMLSYFYTNKAADFLLTSQPSRAYAYFKAAIRQDGGNESAWMNLGVLFSQEGLYNEAKQYYQYALILKPGYPSARENLAILYKKTGELFKAKSQLAKLHRERSSNPFYYKMLGDVALDEKTYKKAIKHYKKAIAMSNKHHEFYFSLAKAYYASGDFNNTRRYLETAKRRARGMQSETQYASKISALIASR